ncbi:MAG: energy-coupling factor ABC transporter permease [Gallionella sp.]
MNFPSSLFIFGDDWLWLGNLTLFILIMRALQFANWRELFNNNIRCNALIGLMFCTPVFWLLNAGIHPGFNFHLIGATLFTLMFGWPIALIMLSLVMLGIWIFSGIDLVTLGINGLVMLVVPILFSEGLLRFSQRYLKKNPFLFVLFNGFVCAGLAILMMTIATTLLLLALSGYTWTVIQHHYLIPAPGLIFIEAFATGALITGFTVSQPEAVMNFKSIEFK